MHKICVGVLFGGVSPEHEVSLISAFNVISNIPADRFQVYAIGITKKGEWYLYSGAIENLKEGDWEKDLHNRPVILSHNPTHHGLLFLDHPMETLRLDCIFPVLHGKNGEDGTVQGLFELAQIPFVGCDLCASANCMDKACTHIILENAGIRMAKWRQIKKTQIGSLDMFCKDSALALGFPIFIKPANAGSSIGICKAYSLDDLKSGILNAFRIDDKVIVEEAVQGKEIESAVLGNDTPKVSCLGEIVSCNEFYDYEAKYQTESKLIIPAVLSEETTKKVQKIALKAFSALNCRSLARIDFFVTPNQTIILNEINTMPGFTSISMYPKLWENSGLDYAALLEKLICDAISAKTEG